ncbi:hypothetical protein [Rhodobacter maris]|uniref:Uncharacterized protein n=1 Tax=Rhodobacter maris TaxID=446682 RepID=A0A285RJ53_9RHOB|nr:hypothetical protein [Rhodobacter maris]SOB93738.1 hypothetical protein SAMN05877831_101238 [Rhodobacter maris]
MDLISGLMPQTGWSPLFSPATPKVAPATTVEPASTAANTNSGLGAETDAKSQQDRIVQLQARRDLAVETAVLAQSRSQASPDPDAPTGPPPTFDVTPLEARAVELRSPTRSDEAAATASEAQDSGAETAEPATAEAREPVSEPASSEPTATAASAQSWQAGSESAPPSLDLIR